MNNTGALGCGLLAGVIAIIAMHAVGIPQDGFESFAIAAMTSSGAILVALSMRRR